MVLVNTSYIIAAAFIESLGDDKSKGRLTSRPQKLT